MSDGPAGTVGGGRGRSRFLPLLLVPVALLTDLAAALPLQTYYFRDFSVTFYPLRAFATRELSEGRLPFWNPYIFEGSFAVPALYPPELLHALAPGPLLVSWLLTLHLPLAALAAFWLARELGAGRAGAFTAGVAYALGGLALSSLNLYVFLQALALAPFVVGFLRRAAAGSGREVAAAAVTVALALSTLAVEFVGQALLLGLALGLAWRPAAGALGRMSLAVALGAGLAALPLALTLGLLPETVRGAGFARGVALGNALHPAAILQTLVPNLFGSLAAPADHWWGGRFFSKGTPYFLSLYLGPVVLALAAVGLTAMERRVRRVLLALTVLGLWYALGETGGLAGLVADLPGAVWFRFPVKALLLPHLALGLAAGFGIERLRRDGLAWRRLAVAAALLGAAALALAATVRAAGPRLVAWTGVVPEYWPSVVTVVTRDAAWAALASAAVVLVAVVVARGRASPALSAVLLTALTVADLTRAGAGINPQTSSSFFELRPEIRALGLNALDGGRVFSYGPDHSPAFLEFLNRGVPQLGLAAFSANRQVLSPYNNVIDRVEAPEGTDLTSFVPRPRELGPSDYEPSRVGRLVPWLRQAAVTRVLSFDPLVDPDLEPLGAFAVGPAGLAVHAYRLLDPWPRAYVACRVLEVRDVEGGLRAPYEPGFEPDRDVALEAAGAPSCRAARARRIAFRPGEERYEVRSDGDGYLVTRDSYARGWRAWIDGRAAPVLRANGKHRAVPVPAGSHEVRLRYEPPALRMGIMVTAAALAVAVALAGAGRWRS